MDTDQFNANKAKQRLEAIFRGALAGAPTPLNLPKKNGGSCSIGGTKKAEKTIQEMIKLLTLVLLLALGGCGSAINAIDETAGPKPGMAQVVMLRVGNLIPAGNASIEVNGRHVVTLGTHERYAMDIAPGDTSISVSASLFAFGRYTVSFKAEPGTTYKVIIAPRADDLVSSLSSSYNITEAGGSFKIGGAR